MAVMLILYVTLCALIATLGRDRKMGTWAFFALSLILSPLLGAIIVFISAKKNPPVE